MAVIVGRKFELNLLSKIAVNKNAELVAVYGRRRIGKTFLIREFFSCNSDIFFL